MNRIRIIRKQKHLSMRQLGEMVGVTEGAISHYETGRRTPPIDVLRRIADALGVTVDDLLGTHSEPVPANEAPALASALLELLRPYPDVLAKFAELLPRMTVEDLQHFTNSLRQFIDRLNDEK